MTAREAFIGRVSPVRSTLRHPHVPTFRPGLFRAQSYVVVRSPRHENEGFLGPDLPVRARGVAVLRNCANVCIPMIPAVTRPRARVARSRSRGRSKNSDARLVTILVRCR